MFTKVDVSGHLSAKRRVELLKLPAAKRKRILGQVARKVQSQTRKRLRAQRDIGGRPWKGRTENRKQRLLRRLGRNLQYKYQGSDAVDITFKNPVISMVAYAHQYGVDEKMNVAKMQRRYGTPDYDAPASKRKAKALRAAGYKIRRKKGKGWKAPTLKWITENLTQGQAGLVLRILRDKPDQQSWVIPLPARSFLGASESDVNAMVETILDNTLNRKGA